MGTPLIDASSRRGREAAVETLIDMDPNGAAYRIPRAKNAALLSALRERPNRITDGALFDAAHALGKYEIALDSPEVSDLYGQESNRCSDKRPDSKDANGGNSPVSDEPARSECTDSTVNDKLATTTNKEPAHREGWESRILRHHDKIIRAKNNANPTNTVGKAATASTLGGMPIRPTASTHYAVPPPALISAIRQVFGSASNLQDSSDNTDAILGTPDGDNSGKMSDNTLPSLLYTVLNHNVFVGTSTTSIPLSSPAPTTSDDSKTLNNVRHERSSSGDSRKSLDSMRDPIKVLRHVGNGKEERGDEDNEFVSAGEREAHHSSDSSVATSIGGEEKGDGWSIDLHSSDAVNTGIKDESLMLARTKEIFCEPSAANLESILGNACRDILHSSGSQNSRMHGLLIAALSVMTGCLFSQEELESINYGGVTGGTAPSTITTSTPRFLDSSNTADPFAPLLQVGALLSLLPTSEETNEFAFDKNLLRYFATASSLYEERIEIQKAKLFQSQIPLPPSKDVPKVAQLPPLPLQENKSDFVQEVVTSANNVVDVRADRTTSDSEVRVPDSDIHQRVSEVSGISESRQLNNYDDNSNIDVVPASDAEEHTDRPAQETSEVLAHIDDDDDGDDDENDDIDANERFYEEDPNVGDEFSESDHDDDTGSSHEKSDDDEDEDDDGDLDDEDQFENDDEDEELQRALTLSLVAAVGADSSDESRSDDGCSHHSEGSHSEVDADSHARDAITEAAAGREEALKMDVSSSANVETTVMTSHPSEATSEKSATLPPLPTPPPLSILPSHDRSLRIHPNGSDDRDEFCSDRNTTSVFEPSSLSNFGKLPSSHILVHLFLAIFEIMQDRCPSSDGNENGTDQSAEMNGIGDHHRSTKFLPDSTTASFLIVSLHLLSHLRESALKMLKGCISSSDDEFNASIDFKDEGRIQTAHTSALVCDEADDPLIDPAGVDVGAMSEVCSAKESSESLENKGLKRKAAAAVQMACLRSETKLKLVKRWTNRVAFFSTCCILNLKCLRRLMGRRMEYAGVSSSLDKISLSVLGKKVKERPPASALFSIPPKARLSLLRVLSSFNCSSASKSFQSLKLLMINFDKQNDGITLMPASLQDQTLALCNESLCLWGYALPLLYPDHQARVELLESMLESSLSSVPSMVVDSEYKVAIINVGTKSCDWSDNELLGWKIDIMCKRLRVSDMLDCFVAAPVLDRIGINVQLDQNNDERNPRHTTKPTDDRQNSLPILLSLLSKTVLARSYGAGKQRSDNLTKFYLALCQRVISFLILWNDLSTSSIDANDHDISGGDSSFDAGLIGGIGSSWADRGSLQLKSNPESFYFDSTRCADSISVTSSASLPPTTANQRATKVWGTVLSTTCFLPKSGVHRWAVKLDKCERGHVFVGVSTSRTNLKTYVGGDSFGWGLIGTQALWHDRTKIRGDYGATFRTGAVVVITLDTNAGTLSFGLWKEGSPALDTTHAPLLSQSRIGSARRVPLQGQAGGGPYIEDWGIAFEGLPLDVKLYPAVGLYQRDDRVTLCTIVSCGGNPSSPTFLPDGDLYYPAFSNNSDDNFKSFVRSWNETLCSDGVSFATEIFRKAIQQLSTCDSLLMTGNVLMTEILPCLASSICLIPSSIPTLSTKYAMELLPFVTRCAKAIDKHIQSKETSIGIHMRAGEWTIRTSSTSEGKVGSKSSEAYIALIEQNDTQNTATEYTLYEGKSLTDNFSIFGASCGTRVYLVEERCTSDSAEIPAESRIIEARLSLDGASFGGVRYVENGSSERVTGFLQQSSSIDNPDSFYFMKRLIQTECLLGLAVGHLSLILCSQTSMTDIDNCFENKSKKSLDTLLSTSFILSRVVLDCDGSFVNGAVHSISDRCMSEDLNTEIRDQWNNAIFNDLLSPTNKLTGNMMKMEDVMTIIEQQSTNSWAERMGSLSRLCPDRYAAAQKSIACAIFYHTFRSSNESISEIVSQAIQHSKQILENGVREALIRARDGVRFKSICEDHCSLLVLLAQFLFEFSCVPDINHSLSCSFDDIAHIAKSIHSEEDLDYIKQKLRIRSEKCTMQCVGIRSLHLLLQPEAELPGVGVHVAVEAALISLPRLLCPFAVDSFFDLKDNYGSSNHCTLRIAGCTDSIRSCIHSSVRSIYARVGLILESSVHQVKSPTLGLLACYFTDVHLNEHNEIIRNVLPSLKVLMDYCKLQAPSSNTKLLNNIYNQRNLRLLETSATILLVSCGQLSHCSSSSSLVDVLTENLFHEISDTIALVAEDTRTTSELEDRESVVSDWITCRTSPGAKTALNLSANTAIRSSKSQEEKHIIATMNWTIQADALSSVYLNQLLDVLHVVVNAQSFTESIHMRSGALLSTIGFIFTMGDERRDSCPTMHWLPSRFKRRLLRLLRPIIISTKADSSIIRQLFLMAGTYAYIARESSGTVYCNDGILTARCSISLLRHLYTFSSSWRESIHQLLETQGSNELLILNGVLAFLGGIPGFLSQGELVRITSEASSSSSSTVGSSKNRHANALPGFHLNAKNTLGSGAEEIAMGLCRHNSLFGVVSSIDSHHGTCEVIVLDKHNGGESTTGGASLTTRAIHVSVAHISAADELPLYLDVTNLPAIDVFSQLSDTFKNVSTVISSSSFPDSDFKLDMDVPTLMICCLGLRSMTVSFSEPKFLQRYIGHESGALRLFVAQALHIGSVQSNNTHGLNLLPILEARLLHLLLMRIALESRVKVLDHTSPSKLKILFEDYLLTSDVSPKTASEGKGNHSSSTAEVNTRVGHESSSRSSVSHEASSNEGRENDRANSVLGQNDEDSLAAAHLREAAIVQMAELGLPRQWAELALSRVGGTNIEAAVHFCLERGGDMESLLVDETQRRGPSTFVSGRRRGFGASRVNSSNLIRQLVEMGFPHHWCVEALSATRNNVDEALTWILMNGDRLTVDGEAVENGHDGEAVDDDNDSEDDNGEKNDESHCDTDNDEKDNRIAKNIKNDIAQHASCLENSAWSGICPIRCVSGRPDVNPHTLEVIGSPNRETSSVGTKGVLLTAGKWYYEVEIKTAGCVHIGWADSSFTGHSLMDESDTCDNGPHTWTFDGWRRYRWHANATDWGCKWNMGDVVGVLVDMDSRRVSFTLNGKGEEIGMGIAFSDEGFCPSSGVYAYVCLNRREQVRLIIGGKGTEPFKYPPPDGYCGVGEAVLDVIRQRDLLLAEEKVLDAEPYTPGSKKKILTDCSDGDHGHELFAWQHRYHGSDASVHLGSSRPSIFGMSRVNLTPSKSDSFTKSINPTVADLSSRLSKILRAANEQAKSSDDDAKSSDFPIAQLRDAYGKIDNEIESEVKEVLTSLCVLYARKMVMHVVISSSNQFAIQFFLPTSLDTPWSEDAHLEVSRRLWQVIEECTSLKNTGWVGEAGAMALAAEALGLGISTGEKKLDSMPAGMCTVSASNDQTHLPCGGVSQFLTAATTHAVSDNDLISPTWTFAACAENAVGRGVGGSLPFIRSSLQSAAVLSPSFRAILLASVRRATRILSAVEYSPEDDTSLEDESDDRKRSNSEDTNNAPDARFVSFVTGLLISEPVSSRLSDSDNEALRCGLFEAWCIGLLSTSCPWQMVSAFTAAGILNICPQALAYTSSRTPIIARYLGGLERKVMRRSWSERAAVPVVSKYLQSLIELLASVKRATRVLSSCTQVNPPTQRESSPKCANWECSEGWVLSNESWDVWTGTVELMEVDWQTPGRSSAHTLMDSGEGPPMLRENCKVLRGVDWESDDDDGREIYERDKLAKEKRKLAAETEEKARSVGQERRNDVESDQHSAIQPDPTNPACEDDPAESFVSPIGTEGVEPRVGVEINQNDDKSNRKKKKIVLSKLPVGTVLSIEPWKGVPAMARRVRWHLTGKEGIYRYGGDGGCFDLLHVETNEKETRVKKKYLVPETLEQCASRCGFGVRRLLGIILRLNKQSLANDRTTCDGILEWPDFGAGVRVECTFYSDGAISITEKELLFGSKDSGWEPRFGQPNYVSGQTMVISPTRNSKNCDNSMPAYDEYLGSNSFLVKQLRRKEDGGGSIRVTSEMCIRRARLSTEDCLSTSSKLSPICFDPDFHASSISVSQDLKSVTCINSEGRGVAFGNIGFTKGVHYWEVKLERADIGSVFIGVAEKPSGIESQPRLNRWLGWGFVNFRATYSSGAERVYGVHCHAGDTIGVMLDCDAGRLNYFIDGVKYGEHILNDLGCAFENISPMGFDTGGCGSGGAAQGAPSAVDVGRNGRYHANSVVQPKALWPVIGLRHPGDQVTMSSKWMTSHGVNDTAVVKNIFAVDEVLCAYECSKQYIQSTPTHDGIRLSFPQWFIEESFHEYNRWESGRWLRSSTRGSGPCKLSSYGLDVDLDVSPLSCAAACASLGLPVALLHGDRVEVKRSAGRILELQEEAVVLGVYQGRLFYRIVSQKSEGGSLTEGGGRSWFWEESEAVEGGLKLIGEGLGRCVPLPKLRWFSPHCGGLKVIHADGAVVRSDLEIFEGVASLGTIACGTIIPSAQVIERRLNSCGIPRYLIECEPIGRGWISSRMRGGKEEQIIEILPVCDKDDLSCEPQYITPEDSATEWYKNFSCELDSSSGEKGNHAFDESMKIQSIQEFGELLRSGVVEGMTELKSDSLIAFTYGKICDSLPFSSEGECSFKTCSHVLCAAQPYRPLKHDFMIDSTVQEVANEALVHVLDKLPSTKALMARISMLRALNRRARYALPWLPLRLSQESSAILGGLSGFGSSLERAGRSWDTKSTSSWIQPPSISSRLRNCKKIFFPCTTRYFLDSVMDATTSPTPLSHDEYELPREIRTVRVNRLKARRAMASDDNILKKKYSVFSQLQKDISGLSGATLRRGFVAKGHGGQKRAFKVKLIGEGVNDYSGPYREVFTDSMREITDLDSSGRSSLGVLQPTANNQSDVGDGRDLFIFSLPPGHDSNALTPDENTAPMLSREEKELLNSFNSLTMKKDESYREIEEAVTYLGKLVGTACRHGIPVDLPLPFGLVWDRLTEESYNVAAIIKEIDILAFKTSGDYGQHTASSTCDYMLATQRKLLNAFTEGLSSVVPVEIFPILTGEQLRDIICGNPDIDVELLRRVVEYEGYTESDRVVNYFWDVLREMTTLERKHFLQFVWARNRLPLRASDFEAPFVIQKDTKDVKDDEYPLPSASTCFFSLSLPDYPTKEELRKKLMYAIENVTTMESDFVTNDAEISEGWRGL